jgi:chromosome segregation ATPase
MTTTNPIEELEKVQDELKDLKQELHDLKNDTELDTTDLERTLFDAEDNMQSAKDSAETASSSAQDAVNEADEAAETVQEALGNFDRIREELSDLKISQRESEKTLTDMNDRINRVLYTVANVISGLQGETFKVTLIEVLNMFLLEWDLEVVDRKEITDNVKESDPFIQAQNEAMKI